ncbi:hypothetical protein [Escherichia sp. E4385]|uniref:hypothetical protein n=1 Tax=Escherichia sp. E4385 TaxID=2040639 RepID=UPI001F0FF1A0|nr:hypothetical protein [Escherichia sp. E4385]
MKSLTHNLFYVFISAFLIACSHLVFAAESITPEDIVHDFYSEYLKNDAEDNDILVKKYVSDQLLNSIADSAICNYDSDDSISASELKKKYAHRNANVKIIKGITFVTGAEYGLSLT